MKKILNELSKYILEGNVKKNGTIMVDTLQDDEFVFFNKEEQ